jgi:hypothetical protein
MSSIAEQYVERYYNEYDDTDRYFDYVYDIYEHMNSLIEERGLCILDNHSFTDFFSFYIKHMNRDLVDQYITSAHLRQLRRELGKSVGEITHENHIEFNDINENPN